MGELLKDFSIMGDYLCSHDRSNVGSKIRIAVAHLGGTPCFNSGRPFQIYRMLKRIRSKFWWKGFSKDVWDYI